MPRSDARARVQAMVDDLLHSLRAVQPRAPREVARRTRDELSDAARGRLMARHGRPLLGWHKQWEREREAQDDDLAKRMQEAT